MLMRHGFAWMAETHEREAVVAWLTTAAATEKRRRAANFQRLKEGR